MRILIPIIAAASLLCSCARILLPPTTNIRVNSVTDSVKICINNDTFHWTDVPVIVTVPRSKNNLLITAKKDSVVKNFVVKSELSPVFLYLNLYTSGIGYLVDLSSPKRFTYPVEITINPSMPNGYSYRKSPNWDKTIPEKNLLSFKISIPESNHFYLNKGNGYGNAFGFLGISAGVEYYFSKTNCINADFGALTDFIIPFPAPFDHMGSYNQSFARYADLQIGSDYHKFHSDFGIQYTRTTYVERETVDLFPNYIDTLKYYKIQRNGGLAISSYFRVLPNFNIGVNYYPSFFNWDNKKIEVHYSHLLFFELMFRFNGYRPGKRES